MTPRSASESEREKMAKRGAKAARSGRAANPVARIVVRTGSFNYHIAAYKGMVDGVPVYRLDGEPGLDSEAEAVSVVRAGEEA